MEDTQSRSMQTNSTFTVPVQLMWEVWTNPEHIVNWWGPNGFTNTIDTMDVKEGGEWKFTMHGPDGTNFPNKSIYKEIIPFKKIVFEHFNPHFIATVIFDSQGDKTFMDWSLLFDTVEMRDIIVKVHKADEGQKQNIEKLHHYLSTLHNQSKV